MDLTLTLNKSGDLTSPCSAACWGSAEIRADRHPEALPALGGQPRLPATFGDGQLKVD